MLNSCVASAMINVVIPVVDTTSSTSSINKYSNSGSLKLYPVPATNQLNISLGAAANNTHIEMYDMLGKKVLEQKVNDGVSLSTLDVSVFASGTYFIRIIGNNTQKTAKFILDK